VYTIKNGEDYLKLIDAKEGLISLRDNSQETYHAALLTKGNGYSCLSFYPPKTMRNTFEKLKKDVVQGMFQPQKVTLYPLTELEIQSAEFQDIHLSIKLSVTKAWVLRWGLMVYWITEQRYLLTPREICH
jgi:hypothetical protein